MLKLSNLLRELSLDVLKFLLDSPQLAFQFILLLALLLIDHSQLLQLCFVFIFSLLELLVLLLDQEFFLLDVLSLLCDVLVHGLAFQLLLLFVLFHMLLKILFQLLNVFDFDFLGLQL